MRTLYGRKLTLSERWCRAILALVAAVLLGASGTLAGSDLLPAATALPCPDGSQTCGPQPTQDPGPTQGNQVPTTAPQAPQTTIPPNTDTGGPTPPTNGNPGFQGTVQSMPTPDNPNGCIVNCGPTQTQAPTQQQTVTGSPTATSTALPTSTEASASKPSEPDECSGADTSAIVDGKVSIQSNSPEYAQAISRATSRWNDKIARGSSVVRSEPGAKPTLIVETVDEPSSLWPAVYVSGGNASGRILLNKARMQTLSPAAVDSVIAHEIGHALGLADNSSLGSIMHSTDTSATQPSAADIDQARRMLAGANGCKVNGVRQYKGFDASGAALDSAKRFGLNARDTQYLIERSQSVEGVEGDDVNPAQRMIDDQARCLAEQELVEELEQYLRADPTTREQCSKDKFPRLRQGDKCKGPVAVCVPKNNPIRQDYFDRDEYVMRVNGVLSERSLEKQTNFSSSELADSVRTRLLERNVNASIYNDKSRYPNGADAGHVPDMMWTGLGDPPGGYMPMSSSLNRSIGAQGKRYPIGYQVSQFMTGKWVDDVCVPVGADFPGR